jgi:hypothetical protein
MRPFRQRTIVRLFTWTILLLLLTACSSVSPTPTTPTTLPASPTEDLGGLSSENSATLRSLEKLDDYPFYVMHYAGDYETPRTVSISPNGAGFSCSLFAALGEAGDMFYGRNFDWDFSPAMLLFTDPTDGYASVSMVNLTFLGISPVASRTLTDLPLVARTALLSAPSMPFDGMNEYGLTVGMAAVPEEFLEDASYDPSKPSIGSIGIIRQILDHARDVDDAVAIFTQYNIDFSGGPPIHYLIADPSGKAVLIEFYQGELIQLPNEVPWHLATNHLRCIAEGNGGCQRYQTISERLSMLNGLLDVQGTLQLLAEAKQSSTQWSSVYNMTRGDIYVAIDTGFETIYPFHLDILLP